MIFVTGDKHGAVDYNDLSSDNFPVGKSLTKSDYVIVAGDMGIIWEAERMEREQYLIDWYNSKPWTTLFIDGNHENFHRLNRLPTREIFGSVVGVVSDSIFHLRRGNIYIIEDKTFFTFGGAASIDKNRRREFLTWWKEEIPSYQEMQDGLINLEKYPEIDYIITHTCPSSIFTRLCEIFSYDEILGKTGYEETLREFFEGLLSMIKFKKWYFGHFHQDAEINDKFTLLYNSVIQIN